MKHEYGYAIFGGLVLVMGLIIVALPPFKSLANLSFLLIPLGLVILLYCIYTIQKNSGNLFEYMNEGEGQGHFALSQDSSLKEKIQDLITENKTKEAIMILKSKLSRDNELYNSVCLISGKFAELQIKKIVGLASDGKLSREITKINHAILDLIGLIDSR